MSRDPTHPLHAIRKFTRYGTPKNAGIDKMKAATVAIGLVGQATIDPNVDYVRGVVATPPRASSVAGQDLSGTWMLISTENADMFIAASGLPWMKQKAVAAAMAAAVSTHVYTQSGQHFTALSQRANGEWMQDSFVANGHVSKGQDKTGRPTATCSYFDKHGRLVSELTNCRGTVRTVRYLIDHNTLVNEVCISSHAEATMRRTFKRVRTAADKDTWKTHRLVSGGARRQ